ncbi:MAG: peptidylprolyl isomerase [Paracoccaceae bacterium]|nr:MAG: peptidylprolyl isomerase [Paracoccaceae bacterium]
MIRLLLALATTIAALGLPGTAAAQGLFSPRMIVNEQAITGFEVDQRARMLQLFGAPGDVAEQALNGLIEDRLRRGAALSLGLAVGEDQIRAGMEEFAGRANLTAEEFVTILNRAGVATETFRDFVLAGLLWREVVRARFLARAQITEAEIDRAIGQTSGATAVRVLLSEIVLPAPPGGEAQARALARRLRGEARSEAAFAAAARRYSAAGSAANGGALDWRPVSALPPTLAAAVLGLAPGQVSEPIDVDGGIALFQLRGLEQSQSGAPVSMVVEYAQFLIPEGPNAPAEAAKVRTRVDTCDDLYGVARGLPPERLIRESRTMSEIPNDIGLELARLDAGEVSTSLVRAGVRVVLMLCGRTPQVDAAPSREAIRNELRNQRLASYADGYLEELRADAIIRTP